MDVKVNYCWKCGEAFDPELAPSCPKCHTLICPNGHCYCSLTPEARMAVDMTYKTYNLWEGNPCRKKKSSLIDDIIAAYMHRGLVKSPEEFRLRYKELYERHPEVLQEVYRLRKK